VGTKINPMKNYMKKIAVVLVTFMAISCSTDSEQKQLESSSIARIAAATPELSSFVKALEITGLTATFEAQGNYTVFIPTNTAFTSLLSTLGVASLEQVDPAVLADVLKYHVLTTRVRSTDLSNGATAATLLGPNITVTITPNTSFPEADPDLSIDNGSNDLYTEEASIFINETSRVFSRDIECSNGVIHVIKEVLLPS
jgi:uncharacterized surface protein with fasciclin (FAS1) repeats